jgi:hypothetical protein
MTNKKTFVDLFAILIHLGLMWHSDLQIGGPKWLFAV